MVEPVRAADQEVADGVTTDLIEDLPQGHVVARRLLHLGARDSDQLGDHDAQPRVVDPEDAERREHARQVPRMVGADDVDGTVESALLELVEVVCDVGHEVRRHPVAADQHLILVTPPGWPRTRPRRRGRRRTPASRSRCSMRATAPESNSDCSENQLSKWMPSRSSPGGSPRAARRSLRADALGGLATGQAMLGEEQLRGVLGGGVRVGGWRLRRCRRGGGRTTRSSRRRCACDCRRR